MSDDKWQLYIPILLDQTLLYFTYVTLARNLQIMCETRQVTLQIRKHRLFQRITLGWLPRIFHMHST
jgi:hypothetical protein